MNALTMDINIWIVKNLNDFILSVTKTSRKFRFNDAIKEIYFLQKIFIVIGISNL